MVDPFALSLSKGHVAHHQGFLRQAQDSREYRLSLYGIKTNRAAAELTDQRPAIEINSTSNCSTALAGIRPPPAPRSP